MLRVFGNIIAKHFPLRIIVFEMYSHPLAKSCLNFRKQVELNFALEANLLDYVFHHKKLPIRGQKRAETYLIHHAQEYFVSKERDRELRHLAEQAIYDRKNTLLRTA